MESITSIKPFLAILVSLTAGLLILLSGKNKNLREFWSISAAIIKFIIVILISIKIFDGKILKYNILTITDGINLNLKVDSFGIVFALIASFLWIITTFYSIGYMRGLEERHQTRYFFSFAICLSSTIGIAFSGNLLTFFIFYEVLTLSTYPLVVHKEHKEAISAGRKYLAYTLTGGILLFFSIVWVWSITGRMDFIPGGFFGRGMSSYMIFILFFMFVIGCGIKAAIMPFHSWLPSAMVAPTPVSALLHAVAVVNAGVFGVLRVIWYVFDYSVISGATYLHILSYLAAFTIIVASIIALKQDNLKMRLAYSTISQLSYIILGATLLTPYAVIGSILHFMNHAFMKITMFFCAGSIYVKTHKKNISEMSGIGKHMPLTMGAFAIASLGMIGTPLFCGFVSKLFLCIGTIQADKVIFLIVYLTSTLLNAMYFLPIVYSAFFKPSGNNISRERISLITIPLVITAFFVIILGVFLPLIVMQYKLVNITVISIFK